MGSYQNPIGKPDPFDQYRSEGIEPTRGRPHRPGDPPPPEDKRGLAAHLMAFLQKLFNETLSLKFGKTKGGAHLKKHLLNFQNLLEILKAEDRSEDIVFLKHLADSWNGFIQETAELHGQTAIKGKELIKKIFDYPEHHPHTFGYYLTEYAGQRWIPFPYMDLIHKIHAEHAKHPPLSSLSEWTVMIEEILNLLNDK